MDSLTGEYLSNELKGTLSKKIDFTLTNIIGNNKEGIILKGFTNYV